MGLFGPKFEEGALVLTILAIGQFINVATGSVGYLLMMSGHERLMRNNVACMAIVNIFISLLLIPWLGVIGAAISTAISLAAVNLIAVVIAWRRLNIWTLPFTSGLTKIGFRESYWH